MGVTVRLPGWDHADFGEAHLVMFDRDQEHADEGRGRPERKPGILELADNPALSTGGALADRDPTQPLEPGGERRMIEVEADREHLRRDLGGDAENFEIIVGRVEAKRGVKDCGRS